MRKNRVLVKKKVKGVESKLLSKIAHRALEVLGLSKVELSIALVSDTQIKRLNKLYRNKDKPTDVLSFPIGEKVEDWLILGDIVISVDTAKRQAQELGHSLEEELKRLLVHGLVHLLGYDHELGGEEEKKFFELEEFVLREL
ncbi:rRNA maturation RNase YbeY [Thermocrinis sp.]|jgi:probable rRNA maturation factor|uniref:rRNA maturation RNase YbeY n=1 Tax=Thermocrinis sp. TaxID=2024383 RepID=UPI00260F2347|nr:rRNA maturation RNase YbeY [Thermocrinis sp.]